MNIFQTNLNFLKRTREHGRKLLELKTAFRLQLGSVMLIVFKTPDPGTSNVQYPNFLPLI